MAKSLFRLAIVNLKVNLFLEWTNEYSVSAIFPDGFITPLVVAVPPGGGNASDCSLIQADNDLLNERLTSLQAEFAELAAENTQLQADLAAAIANGGGGDQALIDANTQLQSDLSASQSAQASAEADLAIAEAALATAQADVAQCTTDLATTEAAALVIASDLSTAQTDLASCTAQLP